MNEIPMGYCRILELGIAFKYKSIETMLVQIGNGNAMCRIRKVDGVPDWAERAIRGSGRDFVTCLTWKESFDAYLGDGTLIESSAVLEPFLEKKQEDAMIDEKLKAAIERALAAGFRVQLKRMKDGTVKAQIIKAEELKK